MDQIFLIFTSTLSLHGFISSCQLMKTDTTITVGWYTTEGAVKEPLSKPNKPNASRHNAAHKHGQSCEGTTHI